MSRSDGSTADYYELPAGCTQLQDLISFRNLNAQDGEIFRAIYRKGRASHSDTLRDARKVLFYARAEVERLEKLRSEESSASEPAAAIDDDSERMQAIGQNGNDGEYYEIAPSWLDEAWRSAPAWASWIGCDCGGSFWFAKEPILARGEIYWSSSNGIYSEINGHKYPHPAKYPRPTKDIK